MSVPAALEAHGELPPLRRLRDYGCLAGAAAGMWASFPDVGWWFLQVPALALLVAAVDRVGATRAAWYGFAFGLAFFIPHISWANVATGGTYLPWIALATAQALFLGAWAWSVAVARVWARLRTAWGEALACALAWVGFEQLRSRIPFGGFPWAKLAYAQVDAPLGHVAPIGGEVAVSFLLVFGAVLLRRAVSLAPAHADGRWYARPACVGVALAILAAPLAIPLPTSQQAGSVRVGIVQGNVEVPMERTFATPLKVTRNHTRETLALARAHRDPDVVMWGENSTDRDPRWDDGAMALVQRASSAVGVPMLVGIVETTDAVRYNWVGVWYPKTGLDPDMYGKQHPVPFGEYIPWRAELSHLATDVAKVSVDMAPVDNPGFLKIALNDGRTLPIALGICFEVAYEPILDEGVRMGGQMLVIPTNNAHFRASAESTQQLQMLRFRAVEFGRSAVQVSTNGVSAAIRPDGGVVAQTGRQVPAWLVEELPLRTSLTPAARMGEFLPWTAIVAAVAGALASGGAYLRTLTRRNDG